MGNQKPSFNHKVIKGMKLEVLIEQHPEADPEHVKSEWGKVNKKKEKDK